jgi:hypothetical protein
VDAHAGRWFYDPTSSRRCASWGNGVGEPQSRGFLKPSIKRPDRSNVAGQSDFAERNEPAGQGGIQGAAGNGKRYRHVGRRFGEPNAADCGHEAIRGCKLDATAPLENSEHHRNARGVQPTGDTTRLWQH